MIGRDVMWELIQGQSPKVLQRLPDEGIDWTVHYAFFVRASPTSSSQAEAGAHGALLVELER